MLQSNLFNTLMDRRKAFQVFGGASAAGLVALPGMANAMGSVGGAKNAQVNFEDPAENLKNFVRLTGSADPEDEVFGWFGGTIFSVVGDKALTPLVDVEGFGVMRSVALENGNFRLFNRELAFYKDPKTKQFIDVWENPVTGEKCDVSPIHNAVVNAEIAPIIKQDFDGTIVEIPFKPPWDILEETAMSTFEIHTAFPNPMSPNVWKKESAGPITRISEVFQRSTPLAQLADTGNPSVDYVGTWTRLGPWLPWMLMGQREGHVMYRTFTKKMKSYDNLSAELRALTEERYPEYTSAPGDETWGQPNDSSFTTYMAERTPVK